MTTLITGSQGFADADLRSVTLQDSLGGFDLVLRLDLRTSTPETPHEVTLYAAAVQLAPGAGAYVRLGEASPGAPFVVRTYRHSSPTNCEFRLPLTAHQIGAIEELRDTGDLQVRLAVLGYGGPLGHPEHAAPVQGDVYKMVPRSDWIATLADAKAMNILLLEVPIPFLNPSPAHLEMAASLRAAQRHFIDGNYSESVSRCRTAIEAMTAQSGRGPRWTGPAFKIMAQKKSDEVTKDERELILEAALYRFTHLGAHPNEVEITRREAKLALSLTAGVLAYRAG